MKEIVIFGSGGHALSIYDLLLKYNYKRVLFCDDNFRASSFHDLERIALDDALLNSSSFHFALGIGAMDYRRPLIKRIRGIIDLDRFPVFVHDSAYVSTTASIGAGTIIFAQSYIGPLCTVAPACIVNTNSVVEHESSIGFNTIISPSVTIAGKCIIGSDCFFGMGSLVSDGVSIGDNSIVGANSFVKASIPAKSKVLGTPGRIS